MVGDIEEQTARLMFGAEMPVPGRLGFHLWAMEQRATTAPTEVFRLNPIIAWAVAAAGGRYIASAQNR